MINGHFMQISCQNILSHAHIWKDHFLEGEEVGDFYEWTLFAFAGQIWKCLCVLVGN